MVSDKRKRIVEAASKSFANFGYKATTVDQIAKIAKVGKGTIYTYFSNKEELLKEITVQFATEMRKVARDSIVAENSFITNLHTTLHHVLQFRDKHELIIKLSQEVNEMGTPQAMEALVSLENELCELLKTKIERAINKGELRHCDPKLTAFLMYKMYVQLVYEWKKWNEKPLTKEEIAHYINLYFMEGLKKQDSR